MKDHLPEDIYIKNISELNTELKALSNKKTVLAWARFISFCLLIAAVWILWPTGFSITAIAFSVFTALFILVIKKDLANKEKISNCLLLRQINEHELLYIKHQFTSFPDGGELKPENHPYANDLDIFGRASLYQYINRTTSQQGHQLLAYWLLNAASPGSIEERQRAVKELSAEMEWRQQLQAYGIEQPLTTKTENNILEWLREENSFINKKSWRVIRFILPLISFGILALFISDIINDKQLYTLLLVMFFISMMISKKIMPAWTKLGKITKELETLSDSIHWIESKSFDSPLLQQLKQTYSPQNGKTASGNINALKKILDRLDYRLNPIVFVPLSIFLCWDLQQIFSLEKWKQKNQSQLADWFLSLAQMEALSSLGNLTFNHPCWVFPKLDTTSDNIFDSEELGHPLIPEQKRINNSFTSEGIGKINLVTGSNMAGKSTFLRSIGINTVLAMMGSPVCATKLVLSPVKVMSSMRISDNLEESTSTFYAELKKLKEVIEAVYNNEKVFLLLDEILRGTNSADRHAGSKALIKQLIQHKAVGIIATHDLELAKLETEYPGQLHNYHFDVQVANNELYFDYKLKGGICRSMNASILMKKIGIEL